jgi:transposase-like protein
MSTTESAIARWRRIIDEQERSGLSVAAYCRREQVAASSLFSWKRRLKREAAAASAFVEVQQAPDRPVDLAVAIELHLREDRRLLLRPGFDPQTLRQVLAVLEGRS